MTQFNAECGNKLYSETIERKDKELKENLNKPSLTTKRFPLGLIGIIINVIIIFTVRLLLNHISDSILYVFWVLTAFGGLVASFIAGGNYKYGAIMVLLPGLLQIVLLFFLFRDSGGTIFLASLFGYSIAFAILSLIGGLIGIFLLKRFK
jgi:hypothetical protein